MRCHRGTVLAVTPVVLVPWRADNGQRSDIWAYTRKQIWGLRHPGWPIVEGVAPDGPFNRSAAINAAAETAGDWDVAVIADSDTFTERRSLLRAVDAAVRYPTRLWLPYEQRKRVLLSQQYTEDLLDGSLGFNVQRATATGTLDPYEGYRSGVIVVHRSLWDTVGGFDERFVGWGGEDDAFADTAAALADGWKWSTGNLYHLWHPPSRPDHNDPAFVANKSLAARYRCAREQRWSQGPGAALALIHEPGGPRGQ